MIRNVWAPVGAALLLCFVFGCAAPFLGAQSSDASLLGTVTDTSGGVIPGVTVKAANTKTGVVSSSISNDAGIYNFPALQPGEYHVTAEMPGFSKLSFTLDLLVGDKVTRNVRLQVGSPDQVVEVSSENQPVLQFGNNSISGVFDKRPILDL